MLGAAKSVMQWWGDVFGLGGRTALLRHYDVKHRDIGTALIDKPLPDTRNGVSLLPWNP